MLYSYHGARVTTTSQRRRYPNRYVLYSVSVCNWKCPLFHRCERLHAGTKDIIKRHLNDRSYGAVDPPSTATACLRLGHFVISGEIVRQAVTSTISADYWYLMQRIIFYDSRRGVRDRLGHFMIRRRVIWMRMELKHAEWRHCRRSSVICDHFGYSFAY